jgi:OmpA-OmpF porin, OOP family
MKKVIPCLIILAALACAPAMTIAQTTGDILKQQAGQGVHDGATMATQQTANNVSNRLLNKLFNKKNKTAADSAKKNAAGTNAAGANGTTAAGGASGTANATAQNGAPASLKTYSKYDFIPGEKILHMEDFNGDAVGDFPARWNTNGTGEIQTIEGRTGKWLSPGKNTLYYPEYITDLPDNFTLQFDLVCSDNYSFYSSAFTVSCVALKNPAKEFTRLIRDVPKDGVDIWFHPQDANPSLGHSGYSVWDNNERTVRNDASDEQFISKDPAKRLLKVSIWRQKQRLRVYLNEEKVWDLPRAFGTAKTYNSLLFAIEDARPSDKYLFSNIRLAVGAPDTRNKLMTEGRFSTTGILFDINSATVRPESYGTLKDIAAVLTENTAVKVKIIGHTDNDGDAALNLTLSRRRADAVKESLTKEFGIDASRIDTDGKGATQPAAPNNTTEGKAQNRRVEFVKI